MLKEAWSEIHGGDTGSKQAFLVWEHAFFGREQSVDFWGARALREGDAGPCVGDADHVAAAAGRLRAGGRRLAGGPAGAPLSLHAKHFSPFDNLM